MSVRSTRARAWAIASAMALGCNTLLDNPPGQLAPTDAAPPGADASVVERDAAEASAPLVTAEEASVPDAPMQAIDATPPVTSDASVPQACPFGDKQCNGGCVPVVDPAYGCGPTMCSACSLPHTTSGCSASGCAVATCDPGYADCDQDAANGCEVDLSQPAHCGTCNAKCPVTAPDCAPAPSGFACTTGCGAGAPTLCGNQCVSLMTSLDDCGACAHVCPVVANGEASCSSGVCGFVCHADFHACGGACASDVSPATCGTSCAPCPTGPNAVATCDGATCGLACEPGFANCDGLTADGCEVSLLTDPANCGGCQVSCGGRACSNGVCAPPPDAGAIDAGHPPPDSGTDAGSIPDAGSPG
jgi:hypothetical protein